jgi:hypothetical protein
MEEDSIKHEDIVKLAELYTVLKFKKQAIEYYENFENPR